MSEPIVSAPSRPIPLTQVADATEDRCRTEKIAVSGDPVEHQLTRIWELFLDARPIGIRDNFFDLGGNTHQVRRLLARIKTTFGREIPIGAFFQAQTIEEMANVLRWRDRLEQGSMAITLQPGSSKRVFFMIYPGFQIRDLLHYLGSDRPVYGILEPGLDGKQARDKRIEDMAGRCVKEISNVQSEGPYLLGGRCLGGLVAFEMAKQLQARGQEVALLALFDTPAPINFGPSSLSLATMDDSLEQTDDFSRSILRQGPKERMQYALWRIAYKSCLYGENLFPESLKRVNQQAFRRYTPSVYSGRIIYFWAKDTKSKYYSYGRQWGWRRLAGGGLDFYSVPGDRATMMREPNVRVVGEKLRALLRSKCDCSASS